jgi:hypothetical protein
MTKTAATEIGRDTAERMRTMMDATEFGRRAREAAYTLVGLGVMGAQRANVATKQAVTKLGVDDSSIDLGSLRAKTKDFSGVARRQLSLADDLLEGAIARIEEALSPLEVRLPGRAKDTVAKVREVAGELHTQVRTKVAGDGTTSDDVTTEPAKANGRAKSSE